MSTAEETLQCSYLKEAVAAHGSVAWPITFACGSVPDAVTPLLNHVEALGVPNVRLQPDVLPLAAIELQQQVSVPPASFAAFALYRFLLLLWAGLEALLSLCKNKTQGQRWRLKNWDFIQKICNKVSNDWIKTKFDNTILLATSLSLRGRRLVLWLMARRLMCLGRAWNTWLLAVVLLMAFSMALTSAALALAKAPAWQGEK